MSLLDHTVIIAGTELPELTPPPVTRAMLARYAGALGDHNPIHIDSDAAVAAGLDDVIAHGMLSMAFLGRMLTGQVSVRDLVSLHVTFRAPTPVHARLRCTARVVFVDPSAPKADGPRLARLDLTVRIDGGPLTVRGEAVVRLPVHGEATAGPRAALPDRVPEAAPPSPTSPALEKETRRWHVPCWSREETEASASPSPMRSPARATGWP